ISQWLLFLPIAALAGPVFGLGLTTVWLLYAAWRVLQSAWFAQAWQRGDWTHIRL
ncbi:MAG: MATE family efflux transporter, partial [Gammaproteobacteria bacterium]|nr:MATE family efflux transporter [Gammaproteobacteria bacterium]